MYLHRGIQLRLAYSWGKPAILAAGNDREGVFISSVSTLSFIFLFLPCPSLSSPLLSLLFLFSLSLGVVGWCKGIVYLTSAGHPTDIGLQLGKACHPFSW